MYKILLLLIMVVSLNCQSNENITTTSNQSTHTNYLRIPLSDDVLTIDPGLVYKDVQIEVVEQLFLGLTKFDSRKDEVVPELAASWSTNADSSIYTYQLRQDVKWTDGTSVTANDVVWAIQRNLELDSFYVFLLYKLKNAQAIKHGKMPLSALGVRAIDNYTVEFTLEQPINYFPDLTSFWIYHPLPRQAIEQHGVNWIQPTNIQTNGPYKLVDWKLKEELILQANPEYYAPVKIPKIHYLIVKDSELGLAMYKKDDLDILGGQTYLPIPAIANLKSNPILRKEKQIVAQPCTEWYGFTVQQPPLDNPLVRKAIAAAIDKQTLLEIVLQTEDTPALTFLRPSKLNSLNSSGEISLAFDPINAKKWLAEAGYADGKSFPKLFLVHNTSELHHKTAMAIRKMLKHHLNIEVEVREFEFYRYLTILKNPTKPMLFRMIGCVDYPSSIAGLRKSFHPNTGINWVGWDNQKFAELVEQAQQVTDQTQRQQFYQQMETILVATETVIVPLYFYNTTFLVKPRVKDWYYQKFGGQDIYNWSLAKE